jgi:hypothetical protein
MMSNETRKKNTVLRFQSNFDSREAKIMDCAKDFYGSRLKAKAELALVDLFEPLYVALNGGSETDIQGAIDHCLSGIKDLHREALNQCRNYGYSPASQVGQKPEHADPSPRDYDYDLDNDEEPELEFD